MFRPILASLTACLLAHSARADLITFETQTQWGHPG